MEFKDQYEKQKHTYKEVDIATEWNLKDGIRRSKNIRAIGRYSNRMEFKVRCAAIVFEKFYGRYSNRMEFKGRRPAQFRQCAFS